MDALNQINASAWGLLILALFIANLMFNLWVLVNFMKFRNECSEQIFRHNSEVWSWLGDWARKAMDQVRSELKREGMVEQTKHSFSVTSPIGERSSPSRKNPVDKGDATLSDPPSSDTDLMNVSLAPGVMLSIKKNLPGKVAS